MASERLMSEPSDNTYKTATSSFMPMFETFRDELDSHHDRRERIIKASRDITALSKKMIFTLQRVRCLQAPLPASAKEENSPRQAAISELFTSIIPDLQVVDTWRYQRQVSGGVQEYMEAVSFQHYLETQTLITYEEAQGMVPRGMILTEDDYMLGIFDLVGELMRFAVTSMATSGLVPRGREDGGESRDIVTDLRGLRMAFESLDTTSQGGSPFKKDVANKMEVMKSSVEKVEKAVYGMIIRGRERPKGWMPESGGEERGREPVESY